MKAGKYILFGLITLGVIGSFGHTFAQDDKSGGYNAPIFTERLDFKASLQDAGVMMSWKRLDSFSEESLKYYKVVRSTTNSSPVYPEDSYIKYDSNMDFTSYTDPKVPSGTVYYRVCAITNENNRYCSNVVTIKKNEEKKVGMANPAIVYCEKMGGKIFMKETDAGQAGYCKFPNGLICEEWAFYNGNCNKEPQKKGCDALGGTWMEKTENGKTFKLCKLPNGTLCEPSQVEKGTCNENLIVQGTCGGANGQTFTQKPRENLCKLGKPTDVRGNGPWNWECIGANGGRGAICSAQAPESLPQNENQLDTKLKKLADEMVEKFKKSLYAKYPNDEDKRQAVIDGVIEKLQVLKTSKPKYAGLIDYIVEKITALGYDDLGDIEDILDLE